MPETAWQPAASAKHCCATLSRWARYRHKDETRIWIAKSYADRTDNLLCVAAVLETALVIKTVMYHFSWESGS